MSSMSKFLMLVCSFQISVKKVIFKLLYLSFMPTTLYFSYFQTNSIAMLYLVHEYKKKFESTNMDLTHSKFMIFYSFSS